MKKLLITVFLLLIIAGVVFYFGWVQFAIPPDSYAVIFTKTHGWESEPLPAGTFQWRWQRLIPTNMTLYLFSLEVQHQNVRLSGSLPSGDLYGQLLDGGAGFDFEISIDVDYRLKPDRLPALVRDSDLRPDELGTIYAEIAPRIRETALEAATRLIRASPGEVGIDAYDSISRAVTASLSSRIAEVEFISVTTGSIELPDVELYQAAKESYQSVLTARTEALQQAARAAAQSQTSVINQLDLLERYGEILSEYPVLLDYFRLGGETNSDPLNLQNLVPQPGS